MAQFAPVYSAEQKDSIAAAIVDGRQGVKCARDAVTLAERGELVSAASGETLDAFVMPLTTAQALARDERKRRKGESVPDWIRSKGTDAAIEELGVRLVAIASHEIGRVERQSEGKRDLDRARKAGQVLREARALVRGEAPKQGSAQRRARAGDAPDDESAASAAASLVQALRESKAGEAPHMDEESPESADTETSATREHERPDAESARSGINAHAGSAQDARERMRERIGLAAGAS